jgi:hypothetical protein
MAVYGSESDVGWLIGQVEESAEQLPLGAPGVIFELAAVLAELATNAPARRDAAADNLAMIATGSINSIQDLRAYESLPESLRRGAVQDWPCRWSFNPVSSDDASRGPEVAMESIP